MHDGSPPRFSRVARQFLNRHFANKWIGPVAWPARSPDLNPLDFHLSGHLKSIVYATSIEHAEILRNRTEQGFRQIRETPGMTARWMTRRVQAGGHFFASFANVIKTDNSLYLINEDRQDIYLYDFLSLFLGVQSASELDRACYETPCIRVRFASCSFTFCFFRPTADCAHWKAWSTSWFREFVHRVQLCFITLAPVVYNNWCEWR